MEAKRTPDPEDLSEEERKAILQRAKRQAWRDAEICIIAAQLEREAQEEARRASS